MQETRWLCVISCGFGATPKGQVDALSTAAAAAAGGSAHCFCPGMLPSTPLPSCMNCWPCVAAVLPPWCLARGQAHSLSLHAVAGAWDPRGSRAAAPAGNAASNARCELLRLSKPAIWAAAAWHSDFAVGRQPAGTQMLLCCNWHAICCSVSCHAPQRLGALLMLPAGHLAHVLL